MSKYKILKIFHSYIKSCRDYFNSDREICIITHDGKFGLTERHENGKLTILIDCKYNYIDSLCCETHYSNVVGVLLNGKWGLYAFRYTAGSRSRKIDCRQVAECEYDFITVNAFSNIVVLHKKNKLLRQYYNVKTNTLSPAYELIQFNDNDYLECATDDCIRWIDIRTDSVIYTADNLCVYPEKLSDDIYLFTKYDFDKVVGDNKSDLVFFNRDLMVSYVIENIDCLNITRTGYEVFEKNFILAFRKDGKKHIVAVNSGEWDADNIKEIAKEIEYT